MHTTFETTELEVVCTVEKEMKRRYQGAMYKGLRLRVAQIRAATGIEDLLEGPGKWHALTGRGADVYAGHISRNWRIVVQITTTIHVLAIEDYHQ